ncbi:hypothetical protein DFH06DRAFT_1194589 [Mycena polygramma]|nr:hypothetical protein DFH06DRAFT_1194589 [Mycena polygramma]
MGAIPAELRLQRLSLLPSAFQTVAKDAAAGSSVALSRVYNIVSDAGDIHAQLMFLPVLHAVLDRSRMPSAEEMDREPLGDAAGAIARGLTAIGALKKMHKIPPHLLVHMWPQIWIWMELIILYRYCLPHPAPSEEALCCRFALFISYIMGDFRGREIHATDPALARAIATTPGVRTLISRSWAAAVSRKNLLDLYPTALFMLQTPPKGIPSDLDEWIDGGGGTHWHFASTMIEYLDFLIPQPIYVQLHFQGCLHFLNRLFDDEYAQLLNTFLKCGLVTALTRMTAALLTQNLDYDIENSLESILGLLLLIFVGPMCNRWIVEAFRAGLLPTLVAITQRARVPHFAERIFQAVLPSSLARYRASALVEDSLLPAMATLNRLITSNTVPEYLKVFLQIVKVRVTVRNDFESGKYASTQACDNMKCGQIFRKSRFRRCSQCLRRYYCSEACQMTDWREAGHRDVCESFRFSKLDSATPRDRAFMRAVLRDMYEGPSNVSLFRRQVLFMRENPGMDFYTLFNFKGTHPTFGVYAVKDLPRTDPVWVDCIKRARRSGGRMEIHLLEVCNGDYKDLSQGTRGLSRIFPLRSSSSDIQAGLRAIATSLPVGVHESTIEKEMMERIRDLLRKTRDVVQIHCE